ncbi:MAG: EAL domain-containing protein [Fimbriimonadaceae bacterium]|nr:EAL domain-containing protein [Fimbriimonadaceae bacterium]
MNLETSTTKSLVVSYSCATAVGRQMKSALCSLTRATYEKGSTRDLVPSIHGGYEVEVIPLMGSNEGLRVVTLTNITEFVNLHGAVSEVTERLAVATECANLGTWDWNPKTDEARFNDQWWAMLGYEPGELPATGGTWSSLLHPEDRKRVQNQLGEHFAGQLPVYESEFRMRRKDGGWAWIQAAGRVIEASDAGEAIRIAGIHIDITQRKAMEIDLRNSQERYDLAVAATSEGIWDWQIQSGEVFFSPRCFEMLDTPDRPLKNFRTLGRALHPEDRGSAIARLRRHLRSRTALDLEVRLRGSSGDYRWYRVCGQALWDDTGKPIRIAGSIRDIHHRRGLEQQIQIAGHIDGLTGLPNRTLLTERLQTVLSQRGGRPSALLMIDFDRFRVINDALGYEQGDFVLQEMSRRILGCVQDFDGVDTKSLAARLGGDEFAILLANADQERATCFADTLLESVGRALAVDDHILVITGSVGIVPSIGRYARAEDAIRDADTALNEAKSTRKGGRVIYDPKMSAKLECWLDLESELRKAIEEDQFTLYYQPIISLASGTMDSVEALIRWIHPIRGAISPVDFIPIAEETGLIQQIGNWALTEAFRQSKAWIAEVGVFNVPHIHVNLSAHQVMNPGTIIHIRQCLEEFELAPSLIHLEITESTVMNDVEAARAVLVQLRSMGFSIALDDFGTGYSSLACLHQFPIDILKIDKAFISTIAKGQEYVGLVNAILMLAWNLDIKVVAEGVETEDEVTMLQSLQCDYAQGYFFGRPLPPDQIRLQVSELAA